MSKVSIVRSETEGKNVKRSIELCDGLSAFKLNQAAKS